MKKLLTFFAVAAVSLPQLAVGQVTDMAFEHIRNQAFHHSQVMDDAFYLSDVNGPRFTASPAFQRAVQWTTQRLKENGVPIVREEEVGPIEEQGFRWSGRGWSYSRFSAS